MPWASVYFKCFLLFEIHDVMSVRTVQWRVSNQNRTATEQKQPHFLWIRLILTEWAFSTYSFFLIILDIYRLETVEITALASQSPARQSTHLFNENWYLLHRSIESIPLWIPCMSRCMLSKHALYRATSLTYSQFEFACHHFWGRNFFFRCKNT